jgi:hypothetical protein
LTCDKKKGVRDEAHVLHDRDVASAEQDTKRRKEQQLDDNASAQGHA